MKTYKYNQRTETLSHETQLQAEHDLWLLTQRKQNTKTVGQQLDFIIE